MSDDGVRSWGAGPVAKVFGAVFVLGCAVMLVDAWVGPAWDSRVEVSLIFGGIAAATAWWIYWPRLSVTGADVVLRNPVRTVRVPLTEVTACNSRRDGLTVTRADGREIAAWAVQKPPLMGLLRRTTRSDRIAVEVAEAARQAWTAAGKKPPSTLRGAVPPSEAPRRPARGQRGQRGQPEGQP